MAADDDDLELKPADAGALFRAEMATKNFVMGYWKGIVGVIGVVLLCVFFYGQYASMVQADQRSTAGRIASVEAILGAPVVALPDAKAAGQLKDEDLLTAARALAEIARESTGPARVEADLKAAEMFRVAGKADERRSVLEDALPHAEGILAYAAQGALANLELEEGKPEEAIARWRTLASSQEGFLQEQAMLELGLVLEAVGQVDEARQVYADFMAKFASSPRLEKARQRSERLGNQG